MNLIEQLGGYEAAKEKYQALSDSDMITIGPVEFSAKDYFEDELLDYRRQHNIFEVGDKVVHLFYRGSDVQEVKGVNGLKLTLHHHNTGYHYIAYSSDFRHATDEEIKAGHRL